MGFVISLVIVLGAFFWFSIGKSLFEYIMLSIKYPRIPKNYIPAIEIKERVLKNATEWREMNLERGLPADGVTIKMCQPLYDKSLPITGSYTLSPNGYQLWTYYFPNTRTRISEWDHEKIPGEISFHEKMCEIDPSFVPEQDDKLPIPLRNPMLWEAAEQELLKEKKEEDERKNAEIKRKEDMKLSFEEHKDKISAINQRIISGQISQKEYYDALEQLGNEYLEKENKIKNCQ